MDMQGSRPLAVTQQQAWEALNDPEVLKACIPGCESITATGEHAYELVNAIRVGPVAAKFKGKLQLADIDAPNSYTIAFEGNGGAAGFGRGTAKVALVPLAQGCEISYVVNASVGGKIAQVGQRLIDGVAKSMAESFFKRFDEEMQQRYPAPVDASETGAAGAGLVPSEAQNEQKTIPIWLWLLGALVVLLVGYWVMASFD